MIGGGNVLDRYVLVLVGGRWDFSVTTCKLQFTFTILHVTILHFTILLKLVSIVIIIISLEEVVGERSEEREDVDWFGVLWLLCDGGVLFMG